MLGNRLCAGTWGVGEAHGRGRSPEKRQGHCKKMRPSRERLQAPLQRAGKHWRVFRRGLLRSDAVFKGSFWLLFLENEIKRTNGHALPVKARDKVVPLMWGFASHSFSSLGSVTIQKQKIAF